MILVSACLLGLDCRYDGGNTANKELLDFLKDKEFVMVCPEQLGGLQTPRNPSEISGEDGNAVLENGARVLDNQGMDVTCQFVKGAKETLKIAKLYNASMAILKERSPSCGSTKIYDGKFQGKLKAGKGVTVALLEQNDVKVFSEENYKDMQL
ncbi:DUF523 domain-containing protein [Wukongibacter baidiensis]|uniref:DUF523 domain-containing protein n=1 Tax=Wukongibacter baidiensis TaxID=1723361 RepID=UPI003D7FFD7D